jgi:hypothetical protein
MLVSIFREVNILAPEKLDIPTGTEARNSMIIIFIQP